jgi:hypothetical protein
MASNLQDGKEVSAGITDLTHSIKIQVPGNSLFERTLRMTKKILILLTVLTLVVTVSCRREETHIDTTTDTILTDTSMTTVTTDTWATDTMTTDTMATDTMGTGWGTDTMGTSGTSVTGTVSTTNT